MPTQRLVNTYLSKDCTRKCLVYVDANGHYELRQYQLKQDKNGWWGVQYGRTKFKHIESSNRAVAKWLRKV